MAEFGANITESSGIQSNTSVKEGIGPAVKAVEQSSLNDVADMFRDVGKVFEGERKKKGQAFLGSFMNKQMSLIQAVDQGSMTSQFARTQLRKNLIEATNSHSGISDELIKMQKDLLGAAGMGSVVIDGSRNEQLRFDQEATVIDAGLANPGDSKDQFDAAINNMQLAQESTRRYDLEMETISLEKAKVGLTSANLDLLNKKQERATTAHITSLFPAETDLFKTFTSETLASTDMTAAEKVQAIETRFLEIQNNAAPLVGLANQNQVKALNGVLTGYKDLAVKQAQGDFTQAEQDRTIKSLKSQEQILLLNNPVISRAVATADLGIIDALIANGDNLGVMEALSNISTTNSTPQDNGGTANIFLKDGDNNEALKEYYKAVSIPIENGDQALAQAQHLENIFNGVTDYRGILANNGAAGIELTNWMASDAFFKARTNSSNSEVFSDLSAAQETLQTHYADEVWGMVEREFREAKVVNIEAMRETQKQQTESFQKGEGLNLTPTDDSVRNVEEAVTYQATAQGVNFRAVDPSDSAAVSKAKSLNKSLKPIINNTLKAFAHLEGHQNYGQLFETVAEQIFKGDGQPLGGGDSDDLTMEDFKQIKELAPQHEALTSLIDKTEGGGAYDTLLNFSQKPGSQFAEFDVSKMTIGEAISFSRVDGEYARYSKRQVGRVATPMGRYQIVGRTLRHSAETMGLSLNLPFNKQTQDAIFVFLAKEALNGKSSEEAKRSSLRGVWEGFKHAKDAELDAAIRSFESQ